MFRYLPWWDHCTWIRMTMTGPFLPRDMYTANCYGRLWAVEFEDGTRMYPERSVFDVSQVLDVLGYEPGSILTRGEKYWQGLEPGEAGRVLTSKGAGNPLAWEPTSGGGGDSWNPPDINNFTEEVSATGGDAVAAAASGIAMKLPKKDPEPNMLWIKPMPVDLISITAGFTRAADSNCDGDFHLVVLNQTTGKAYSWGITNEHNFDPPEIKAILWNSIASNSAFITPETEYVNIQGPIWFRFRFDGSDIHGGSGGDPNTICETWTRNYVSDIGTPTHLGLLLRNNLTTQALNTGTCFDWVELLP